MFTSIPRQQESTTRTPRYDPELNLLVNPRDAGRFVCVYPAKDGRFRARVQKRINLRNSFPSQLEAAKAVLAWYRAAYGDRWKQVFSRRKVNPWRIRKISKDGYTGYVADIFVDGNPKRVTLADTKRFTGCCVDVSKRKPIKGRRKWSKETEVYIWPTRGAARTAIERFKHFQLGLFSTFRLWRN